MTGVVQADSSAPPDQSPKSSRQGGVLVSLKGQQATKGGRGQVHGPPGSDVDGGRLGTTYLLLASVQAHTPSADTQTAAATVGTSTCMRVSSGGASPGDSSSGAERGGGSAPSSLLVATTNSCVCEPASLCAVTRSAYQDAAARSGSVRSSCARAAFVTRRHSLQAPTVQGAAPASAGADLSSTTRYNCIVPVTGEPPLSGAFQARCSALWPVPLSARCGAAGGTTTTTLVISDYKHACHALMHQPRDTGLCLTLTLGGPSPTAVDAVTQNSYVWFSLRRRASNSGSLSPGTRGGAHALARSREGGHPHRVVGELGEAVQVRLQVGGALDLHVLGALRRAGAGLQLVEHLVALQQAVLALGRGRLPTHPQRLRRQRLAAHALRCLRGHALLRRGVQRRRGGPVAHLVEGAHHHLVAREVSQRRQRRLQGVEADQLAAAAAATPRRRRPHHAPLPAVVRAALAALVVVHGPKAHLVAEDGADGRRRRLRNTPGRRR
ncbi:putative dipeptidyl-aminopeptidase B [Frankliniella fusca]|uniref:Dipeptidyl-aminopeptidase B n=1 Tax=Frankliniella fusca TaxID=407009 RepID=A0AAE1I5U9_9NEOP|nr:putative dipeptidyl-aminopeptidase B [Frankliniella fusca]